MKVKLLFVILLLLAGVGFAEQIATMTDLVDPKNIVVDGEQLFVTDYPVIYIFSLKDFSLQKKFGSEGQGPGEFYIDRADSDSKERGLQISVTNDQILVNVLARLCIFTRKGEFINSEKLTNLDIGNCFVPFKEGYLGWSVKRGKTAEYALNIYDSKLNKKKEIYTHDFWLPNFRDPGSVKNFFCRDGIFYGVTANKIFVSNAGMDDLAIQAYDFSGKKLFTIGGDYEKIKITPQHIENYKNDVRVSFKRGAEFIIKNMKFPEYFPILRHVSFADGNVYVLTFKKEAGKHQFLIFDADGKFLKKIMVPFVDKSPKVFFPYCITKGKLYQIISSEDEEQWTLHASSIN